MITFTWTETPEGEHELRVDGDDELRAVLSGDFDFWTDWIRASGNPLELSGDPESRRMEAYSIVEAAITESQGLGE